MALDYPFPESPQPGRSQVVASGIRWLRMPLPMALDHINLYLLEDDDGWVIVDTGLGTRATQEHWERVFAEDLEGKPVNSVVVTHFHPDHVGQAGWLTERWQIPLRMTELEYFHARALSHRVESDGVPWQTRQFYHRCGMGEQALETISDFFSAYAKLVQPLPPSFLTIEDGDTLRIGGHAWRVIVCHGHAPAHACLYCESKGVLISGDQVLPRITTNVSVTATQPEANPLAAWLRSLEHLLELPADTFVLPAHNLPFRGLRERLGNLLKHHEAQLTTIEKACAEKARSAADLLPILFRPGLEGFGLILAIGESSAHLHHLLHQSRIERALNENGVYCYKTSGAARLDQDHRFDPPSDESTVA